MRPHNSLHSASAATGMALIAAFGLLSFLGSNGSGSIFASAHGVPQVFQRAPDDPDLTCGPANGNKKCPQANQCCSLSGFCGTTQDYCKSPDCQLGFGWCDASIVPSGRNTSWIDRTRPSISTQDDFGLSIYRCANPGHVALTYDDGPFTYTGELLDILEKNDVKATFFITGVNIGKGQIDDPKYGWDKMIKRMYESGHQIASHTWSHADLEKLNEWDRRNEMIKLEMAVRNIVGVIPTYMRPPYSSCNTSCQATMKSLGYHVIYFDLDTKDYTQATPNLIQLSKDIFSNQLRTKGDLKVNSHLSISHDLTYQSAVNLTAHMVQEIKRGGWKGVTVGECLGHKEPDLGAGAWYRWEETKDERDARMKKKLESLGGENTDNGGSGNETKVDKGEGRNPNEDNSKGENSALGVSAPSTRPWVLAMVVLIGYAVVGL